MRIQREATLGLATIGLLLVLVACDDGLQRETGVVVAVDSPALGRVDSFELLTGEGERLIFDAGELGFRSEFPPAHLSEHMVLSDPITVTYKHAGDRLVATQLDDAGS